MIPLQGKSSLGLVYDRAKVNEDEVSSPEKVIEWVCKRHPLFARDLPKQKIIDQAMYRNFPTTANKPLARTAGRWQARLEDLPIHCTVRRRSHLTLQHFYY